MIQIPLSTLQKTAVVLFAFAGLVCASPIVKRDVNELPSNSLYGTPNAEAQAFFIAPTSAPFIIKAEELSVQEYGLPVLPPATLIQPAPPSLILAAPLAIAEPESPANEYGPPPGISGVSPVAQLPVEEYGPPALPIIPPPAPVLPELPALPEIIIPVIPDISGSLPVFAETTTLPPPPAPTTTLPPPTGPYAPAGPISHYGEPIKAGARNWA